MNASRGPEPRSRRAEAIEPQQFIGSHDLLRSRNARVRNNGCSRNGLIRLVELQFRLVTALHIRPARRILQMHGITIAFIGARQLVQSAQSLPVEPGLQRQLFGLLLPVAESSGDGFVDHFFLGNRVRRDDVLRFSEINFTLDKAIKACQVRIHVRADIFRGNGGGKHRRQRLLEWNFVARGRRRALLPRRPRCHLCDARSRSLCLLTCCSRSSNASSPLLPPSEPWLAQPSDPRATVGSTKHWCLLGRDIFHNSLKVHQFRPEHLQPLLLVFRSGVEHLFQRREF